MTELERLAKAMELINGGTDTAIPPNEACIFGALQGTQLKLALARSLTKETLPGQAFLIGYDDGFIACEAIRKTRPVERETDYEELNNILNRIVDAYGEEDGIRDETNLNRAIHDLRVSQGASKAE